MEMVTPHLKSVLKNFQHSATKSLQGPGLSLIPKRESLSPDFKDELSSAPSTSSEVSPSFVSPPLRFPVLTAPDTGRSERTETFLEGQSISCFIVGGEKRLCLPQVLNSVLRDFSLQQINQECDALQIFCSRCTVEQLNELKSTNILPSAAPSCGLITKTDAERLCSALLHRDVVTLSVTARLLLPKDHVTFRVYHECFGKCRGLCTPDLFTSRQARCIECLECQGMFSPQNFVCHAHHDLENRTCHWGFDSAKWRTYLRVSKDQLDKEKMEQLLNEMNERYDGLKPFPPSPTPVINSHKRKQIHLEPLIEPNMKLDHIDLTKFTMAAAAAAAVVTSKANATALTNGTQTATSPTQNRLNGPLVDGPLKKAKFNDYSAYLYALDPYLTAAAFYEQYRQLSSIRTSLPQAYQAALQQAAAVAASQQPLSPNAQRKDHKDLSPFRSKDNASPFTKPKDTSNTPYNANIVIKNETNHSHMQNNNTIAYNHVIKQEKEFNNAFTSPYYRNNGNNNSHETSRISNNVSQGSTRRDSPVTADARTNRVTLSSNLHVTLGGFNNSDVTHRLIRAGQQPPVLQNPEKVVSHTESGKFERSYQPNVALAPQHKKFRHPSRHLSCESMSRSSSHLNSPSSEDESPANGLRERLHSQGAASVGLSSPISSISASDLIKSTSGGSCGSIHECSVITDTKSQLTPAPLKFNPEMELSTDTEDSYTDDACVKERLDASALNRLHLRSDPSSTKVIVHPPFPSDVPDPSSGGVDNDGSKTSPSLQAHPTSVHQLNKKCEPAIGIDPTMARYMQRVESLLDTSAISTDASHEILEILRYIAEDRSSLEQLLQQKDDIIVAQQLRLIEMSRPTYHDDTYDVTQSSDTPEHMNVIVKRERVDDDDVEAEAKSDAQERTDLLQSSIGDYPTDDGRNNSCKDDDDESSEVVTSCKRRKFDCESKRCSVDGESDESGDLTSKTMTKTRRLSEESSEERVISSSSSPANRGNNISKIKVDCKNILQNGSKSMKVVTNGVEISCSGQTDDSRKSSAVDSANSVGDISNNVSNMANLPNIDLKNDLKAIKTEPE